MAFSQSCDQTISGRNLQYSRALEIVQNEEYLSEADLDIIKRRRNDPHLAEAVLTQIEDFDSQNLLSREKRQVLFAISWLIQK